MMSSEEVLKLLREENWDLVDRLMQDGAPENLVPILGGALPDLDLDAHLIAVDCLAECPTAGAGPFLLRLTAHSEKEVAIAAGEALLLTEDIPPPQDLFERLDTCTIPAVRMRLYQGIGLEGAKEDLAPLQERLSREQDTVARSMAEGAAVRLGDQKEFARLFQRLKDAEPDTAKELADVLEYVEDPELREGLLPWLKRQDPIYSTEPPEEPCTIRMCDLAVWNAVLLGVEIQPEPDQLLNFEDAIIAQVEAALQTS